MIDQETIDHIDWSNSISAIITLLEDAVTTNRPVALTPEEASLILEPIEYWRLMETLE